MEIELYVVFWPAASCPLRSAQLASAIRSPESLQCCDESLADMMSAVVFATELDALQS